MEGPLSDRPRARWAVEILVALGGVLLVVWAWRADRRWFEIHTMPVFCAEHPGQLVRAAIERWIAGGVGVLLLFVVRPRAGRWARRHSAREIAGAAARVFGAVLLALVVTDGVLRLRKSTPPTTLLHYEPDSEGDPRFTYRARRSHVTEHVVGEKKLRFVIDANGYRVRSKDEIVDHARPTILFTGESVASGFGLNYEETYAAMVADGLGVQSVNLAVQGYGSDYAHVRLAEELPRFSHPLGTVSLVMHMLVDRNVWPDRPHFVIFEDGTSRFVPAEDQRTKFNSPLLDVFRRLYHSEEGLRRTRALMVATARESLARGALPLFLLVNCGTPCLPDETGAPSIERTLFEGLDLAHVRVDLNNDVFDFSIGHPSARGHRQIADAVERALRERGIVGTSAKK